MKIYKKLKIIALIVVVTISIAAINPQKNQNEYTNLKVLPKDIASKDLQRIMVDEFQDGLGVSCTYCHAQQKGEKGSLHIDYASDEKPEKDIARSMMLMTLDVNKKYFNVEHPVIGDNSMTVSCITCHHGASHPEE